jgi:Sulfatase
MSLRNALPAPKSLNLAFALMLGLAGYFCYAEGPLQWAPWANVLFTTAWVFAAIFFVTLLSRRLLFAASLLVGIIAILVPVSAAKFEMMNSGAHSYDIIFYLGSWTTVTFLIESFTALSLAVIGAVVVFVILAVIVFRLDSTRISRRISTLTLAVCVLLSWAGSELKGPRRYSMFNNPALFVSDFLASTRETIETLWRGQMLEAGGDASSFAFDVTCTPTRRLPHIILIHQESLFPPALYPKLKYDQRVDALFVSQDGKRHPLRVETFGGASWLTEFSVLTGVSTHSFGNMRQFVETFTAGRLHDTVPQVLARCGYRNVLFYPISKTFVSSVSFFTSIGLKEILDAKAQKATRMNERDRFYFNNAMNLIADHLQTNKRPLFIYIITMSAHVPYEFTFEPQMQVSGGGPGTSPEMHEYLRRLSIAKLDYEEFKAELARRFPNDSFVIVQYGDHQPYSTRLLLGFGEKVQTEDVAIAPDSIGYITYFAIDGVNFTVPKLPDPETTVDVPYLGTLMLKSAGVPLPEAYRAREMLMTQCEGRYFGCKDPNLVRSFHQKLINSGFLDAPKNTSEPKASPP